MKTTQNLKRVKELLLTPPTFSDNKARLQTNLDTDFLKLIAIVSMLIDHIGSVFFPEVRVLRWIGRLAFPIFCYCMTVGLLYTHDIKKYLFRLGIFALISQPCYIFAFHPYDFWSQFTNWNIFFTLFLSLLAMYGWKERKWWLFALTFFVISWWNFDYSSNGIFLMLVFYLCRNNPVVGAMFYLLFTVPPALLVHFGDFRNLTLGGLTFDWTFAMAFAALFIFPCTHTNLKVPRWLFYAFYPIHLLIIGLVRLVLKV